MFIVSTMGGSFLLALVLKWAGLLSRGLPRIGPRVDKGGPTAFDSVFRAIAHTRNARGL